MKLQQALQNAIAQLSSSSPTPDVDALYLLTYVLNTNTAWIFLHPDITLAPTDNEHFQHLINLRAQGQPIAYLTQTRGFWSLDFTVNEKVLIPRAETELLVELALKFLPEEQSCQIADLGTGSGAIALSLAHERPNWHLDAVDASADALAVAQLNAQNLQISNVNFYQGSWCEALPQKKYDAIISNPPYLATEDPHLRQGDLRFEPQHALVAGPTGLEAYELIITQAKNYLKPQGLLILEHGFAQREDLIKLLKKIHYKNIQTFDDYQNLPRVIIATN